jgi:dTDP-4-amino-4,6-dideoxy-D-galactose acyltransferase
MSASARRLCDSRCRYAMPEPLVWDSTFWGQRIGRADSPLESQEGFDCLWYLAGADDYGAMRTAEDAGFRMMDVRVKLAMRSPGFLMAATVRDADPDDRMKLRGIARMAHSTTRFYADPRFPFKRCNDFYEGWVKNSLDGWADKVLVAGDADGYVTCHLDGGFGSIGLIAVAREARRQGYGVDLTRSAVAWCHAQGADRMTVVTQGRNKPALATFQKAGFRVTELGVWFHRWAT